MKGLKSVECLDASSCTPGSLFVHSAAAKNNLPRVRLFPGSIGKGVMTQDT